MPDSAQQFGNNFASLKMQAPGTGGRLQQVASLIDNSVVSQPVLQNQPMDDVDSDGGSSSMHVPAMPLVSSAPPSVVPTQPIDALALEDEDVFAQPGVPFHTPSTSSPLRSGFGGQAGSLTSSVSESNSAEVNLASAVSATGDSSLSDESLGLDLKSSVSDSVSASNSVVKAKPTLIQPVPNQSGSGPMVVPIPPVSTPPPSAVPHKEGAPISLEVPAESPKPAEIMQPTEPEVVIAPELKDVVSATPGVKPLDVAVKQAGVALTGEAAPVVKTSTGMVKLPMSYAEAVATEKRTKFRDALHWFARYIEYQWRKLDPTLK